MKMSGSHMKINGARKQKEWVSNENEWVSHENKWVPCECEMVPYENKWVSYQNQIVQCVYEYKSTQMNRSTYSHSNKQTNTQMFDCTYVHLSMNGLHMR